MPEKKPCISLFEYEENNCLDKHQKDKIEKLNSISTPLFDFTAKGIKAKQFVGFCQIGKTTVQVLPKIFSSADKQKDKENPLIMKGLLYMLHVTKKLKINETDISRFLDKKDDLFEVIIYLFAKNLFPLLKKGVFKNYFKEEDNLNFLKGKINFTQHIKYNIANQAKFFCNYDEFDNNILMNQVFKSCIHKLIKITKSPQTSLLLQKCDALLENVDFIRFRNPAILNKVIFHKRNQEYKPVFNLARLLLFGHSYSQQVDHYQTFSFMFDMNRLFEEFIFEILSETLNENKSETLNKNKNGFTFEEIKSQSPQNKIFEEENEINFTLKPDIYIKLNDQKHIIMDTKYKKLEKEEKKYGISQSDIYQIFCYSQYYKSQTNYLIYPKYADEINTNLNNKNPNFNLQVITIDLTLEEKQDTHSYKEKIKKQLKKKVKF